MEIFPVEIVYQNVWVNGKYIGAASGSTVQEVKVVNESWDAVYVRSAD